MIVIRSLVPGGVAEQDGRLKPVDRLMSVNDTNLEHSSLSFAVETLKGTPKGQCSQEWERYFVDSLFIRFGNSSEPLVCFLHD